MSVHTYESYYQKSHVNKYIEITVHVKTKVNSVCCTSLNTVKLSYFYTNHTVIVYTDKYSKN